MEDIRISDSDLKKKWKSMDVNVSSTKHYIFFIDFRATKGMVVLFLLYRVRASPNQLVGIVIRYLRRRIRRRRSAFHGATHRGGPAANHESKQLLLSLLRPSF